MGKIEIKRENGGIGRQPANKDGVSGLLFYVPEAAVTVLTSVSGGAFESSAIAKFATLQDAEMAGIVSDSTDSHVKMMHYHLREAFRMNTSLIVYVGVYDVATAHTAYNEIKSMQAYANGDIRQIGVWDGVVKPTATEVAALQLVATTLESEQQPLSIVFSGSEVVTSIGDLRLAGNKNVSIVVGNDGDNGVGVTAVGIIGLTIGAISAANVHESICWVERFQTGISKPQLLDGTDMDAVPLSTQITMGENGLIFLKTYPGVSGSYFSDSNTLDVFTSDYCYIERVRTMDKAVRGVYANLLPKLGAPMYVNDDGTLRGDSVANIENAANVALEEMERNGELSGYEVYIDPTQNVIANSELKVVIRNVAVGVLRTIKVKISNATKL